MIFYNSFKRYLLLLCGNLKLCKYNTTKPKQKQQKNSMNLLTCVVSGAIINLNNKKQTKTTSQEDII